MSSPQRCLKVPQGWFQRSTRLDDLVNGKFTILLSRHSYIAAFIWSENIFFRKESGLGVGIFFRKFYSPPEDQLVCPLYSRAKEYNLMVVIQLSILFYPLPGPTFLSPPLLLADLLVDTLGPSNKASNKTPIAIPTAVNIDTIVIPCCLKRVLILSPRVPVSLSKNFVIDYLI